MEGNDQVSYQLCQGRTPSRVVDAGTAVHARSEWISGQYMLCLILALRTGPGPMSQSSDLVDVLLHL